MQKKIIIILFVLIVVLLVILGFVIFKFLKQEPEASVETSEKIEEQVPSTTQTPSVYERLKQTVVKVPESDAESTLSSGSGVFTIDGFPGDVLLGDIYAVSDSNIFATLIVNSGGSGRFIYLVWFEDTGHLLLQKAEQFLGDRITIKSISISGSFVQVNILDRREGEPFTTAPTVQKSLIFNFENNNLSPVDGSF